MKRRIYLGGFMKRHPNISAALFGYMTPEERKEVISQKLYYELHPIHFRRKKLPFSVKKEKRRGPMQKLMGD